LAHLNYSSTLLRKWGASIEHLEDYLDAVLTSFDKAQDYVKDEMIKCFMEEELQVKIDS
jgi:hypothetical protein